MVRRLLLSAKIVPGIFDLYLNPVESMTVVFASLDIITLSFADVTKV
jgi:hypothetical protein